MLETHKDLKRKIEAMEKKYDENFRIVFEAIKKLFDDEVKPKKKIGYIKEKRHHTANALKMHKTVSRPQDRVVFGFRCPCPVESKPFHWGQPNRKK
jgi:hypothetical protein